MTAVKLISITSKKRRHKLSLDLTNQRFGRLIVVGEYYSRDKFGNRQWFCICKCNNTAIVNTEGLRGGSTRSCGCLLREHYLNLPGITIKRNSKEYGLAAKKSVYRSYKERAAKKNLCFELDFETFINLTQEPCHYCGDVLSSTLGNRPTRKKDLTANLNIMD